MILKNKIIIVTGGSGLIGRSIVESVNENAGIGIIADVNVATDPVKRTLNFDVTNENSIMQGYNWVEEHFGGINGLVNNAYPRTDDWGTEFENITKESWSKNVDMQMNSVFLCCQKIIPFLIKTEGSIVNIGSIYGVVGNDHSIYEGTNIKTVAPYSAIKGGVINFSRYLASYMGKSNVRVNSISPGGIFDNQDPVFVKNYENKVPMGRMGKPEDIGGPVTFLLSSMAKYITGVNLLVDGGWTCV